MYLIILLFIFSPFNLSAEVLKTNPDHSEIFFQIPYLKISEVTGRFKSFTGKLETDSEGKPKSVFISIKASSLDTGNKLRDSHLTGHDFLYAKKYPEIQFQSQDISPLKDKYEARGTLSFMEKTFPLNIFFSLSEKVTDTWGKKSRFAKFDFQLDRNELGLTWNKTLPGESYLLGDKIHVWGNFQLQPAGSLTHSTKHMIPDTLYAREREKILRGEKEASDFPLAVGSGKAPEPKAEKKNRVASESERSTVDPRSNLVWQVAFGILGMMGFVSTIFMGIFFKKWIHQKTQENHSETGALGLLTDFFIILIVFIYAVSLWEVGWG